MSVVFPINADTRFRISTAVGGETTWSVPFPFQANADIAVLRIREGVELELDEGDDYTLTGAGEDGGGTVTLLSPAVAGDSYIRLGRALIDRVTSVVRGGRFNSKAIDDDIDRWILIAQELARDTGRAIKVPLGETPPTLTPGTENQLLKFDADGNLVPGPDADALEAIETALGVEAGRALVYPASPAAPVYDAGNRKIGNLANGSASTDAITLGQAQALLAALPTFGLGIAYTVSELSTLDVTKYPIAWLAAPGREGQFRLKLIADLSTAEADAFEVDAIEGLFVEASTGLHVWQRIYSGPLNIHWFDVPGETNKITRANTWIRIDICWQVARWLHQDIYFPAGTYDTGEQNFPFRQNFPYSDVLIDCYDMTIFGDGPNTILQTTSTNGADVLQLYGLKNIRFRDFRIKSSVGGSATHGSNGISIVGGFDNIEILDLVIGPLQSIGSGGAPDGGKALTLQSEAATTTCGRLKARYSANYCAQGFGYESNIVNMATKNVNIDVEVMAERCFTGVSFVAGAPPSGVNAATQCGIRVRAHLVNCQKYIVLNRCHGINVDAVLVDNAGAASLKATDFNGNYYVASDTDCYGVQAIYAKNTVLRVQGDCGICVTKAQIGGASPGTSELSGATDACDFYIDLGGAPTSSNLAAVTYAGTDTMTRTRLTLGANMLALADVPSVFLAPTGASKNIVYVGTQLAT